MQVSAQRDEFLPEPRFSYSALMTLCDLCG